ncbi:hypothetical protein [Nocardioides conyzicola]|uniref:Bacterial Ig domain-containing protein n=1 Tax=Nocardioides conyzicola TaxID=1651781 RepID=A0ABP8XSN4_9ACTN
MHVRRLIGSLLATTLAATALTAVATSAPASAATTVPTRVTIQVSQKKAEYNDKISVTGSVQGQNSDGTWGTLPYGSGSATLQFLPKGSSTWKSLQSEADGNTFYFYPVPVKATGTLRVVYSGGTYGDYQFTPSTSSSKSLKVTRKLTYKEVPGRRTGIQGKISPAARIKVVIQKKVGKKYRHFKTVKTARSGKFKIILPAPRNGRFYWKITFTGNKTFVPRVVKGSTYSY